jgi:hypothetical protein
MAGDRTYAGLLDAVLSDLAERNGKARWCEKTPGQRASSVYRMFPDAQVVHLVRDPRAVVASGLEVPYEVRTARELATEWRRFTLANVRVGTEAGPGGFLQVRYEDLVRGPDDVLRLVCAFLGEDFSPAMVSADQRQRASAVTVMAPWQSGALDAVSDAGLDRWRRSLDPRQRARVAAVVRRELPVLGYGSPPWRVVSRGAALNALDVRSRARTAMALRRARARMRTPADRRREVHRMLADGTARWGTAESRGA